MNISIKMTRNGNLKLQFNGNSKVGIHKSQFPYLGISTEELNEILKKYKSGDQKSVLEWYSTTFPKALERLNHEFEQQIAKLQQERESFATFISKVKAKK